MLLLILIYACHVVLDLLWFRLMFLMFLLVAVLNVPAIANTVSTLEVRLTADNVKLDSI